MLIEPKGLGEKLDLTLIKQGRSGQQIIHHLEETQSGNLRGNILNRIDILIGTHLLEYHNLIRVFHLANLYDKVFYLIKIDIQV